jgi:hypothetical protein
MPNLPRTDIQNTDQPVRDFFDKYYQDRVEYAANEVDAVLGFFNDRGFGEVSSSSIATVVLRQASVDGISSFQVLDTLKGLDDTQLSAFVAEILNLSRAKSSALGYRDRNTANFFEARNIIE